MHQSTSYINTLYQLRNPKRFFKILPIIWFALALQWSAPMAMAGEDGFGGVRICSVGGQLIVNLSGEDMGEQISCPDCLAQLFDWSEPNDADIYVASSYTSLQQRFMLGFKSAQKLDKNSQPRAPPA